MLFWKAMNKDGASDVQARCHLIRNAIDQFTADKKTAPMSLEDLIQSGYLPEQPESVSLEKCIPSPAFGHPFPAGEARANADPLNFSPAL
jgi:hypothetical protein